MGVPQPEVFEPHQLKDRNLIALPLWEKNGLIVVRPQPGATLDAEGFLGEMGIHLADYNLEDIRLASPPRASPNSHPSRCGRGAFYGRYCAACCVSGSGLRSPAAGSTSSTRLTTVNSRLNPAPAKSSLIACSKRSSSGSQ